MLFCACSRSDFMVEGVKTVSKPNGALCPDVLGLLFECVPSPSNQSGMHVPLDASATAAWRILPSPA
jgi:hypothetical protein